MGSLTLGHDTEFFLAKDGKIIPATREIIPGTKKEPFKIGDNAFLQLDNVLGEITCDPSMSSSHFMDKCTETRYEVEKYLERLGYDAVFQSHHHFNPDDLMTPWARVAACEPDFAADLDDKNKPMSRKLFQTLRSASGHVHIGIDRPLDANEVLQYVRGLDFALAPLMLNAPDGFERRKLYGQAGRFRFKPYGFEYRTPDNWWFGANSPHELPYHMYSTINQVITTPMNSDLWIDINDRHSKLCSAINRGDKEAVESIIQMVGFYRLKVSKTDSLKKSGYPVFTLNSNEELLASIQSHSAGVDFGAFEEDEEDENEGMI